MQLKASLLIIIFLVIAACNLRAQEKGKSFYDKKGVLKIDTTFSISKKQLKKFREVESYLAYSLSQELQYPPQYRRAGVEGITLYSFKVSSQGEISDIKAQRIRADLEPESPEWVINETEFLEQFFAGKSYVKSLALKKGAPVTYYIPVHYVLDFDTIIRKVGDDLVYIQEKKERTITVDFACPRGKVKD